MKRTSLVTMLVSMTITITATSALAKRVDKLSPTVVTPPAKVVPPIIKPKPKKDAVPVQDNTTLAKLSKSRTSDKPGIILYDCGDGIVSILVTDPNDCL